MNGDPGERVTVRRREHGETAMMVDEEIPETTGETSAVATVGMEETVTEVTEIEAEMEVGGGTMTEIASGITATRGRIMMTGGGTHLVVTETDGGMRGVGRERGQIMLATRNGGVSLQTSRLSTLLFRLPATYYMSFCNLPPLPANMDITFTERCRGANPASLHSCTSTAMIPQHASCSPIFRYTHIP